ncbi:hypothetical protein NPX13_g4668 [Xylaria arbuscula]|uniref:Uncharacterized protein n=1 Tax=Xylaria arbuscula TaxID=114810 RepID=A0A9W8NF31_9PEZI|nr:hypothetical protein NPX13_g4668 [Xylaria arbuscula]
MVTVRSGTRRSAGGAGPAARHASQESEDDGFTPLSTPDPSSDHYTIPRTEFNFRLHHDTALPSIEEPYSSEADFTNRSTPSTPPNRARSNSSPRASGQHDGVNNIDSQLRGMRFSTAATPMGMASVSGALQDVQAGRDDRSTPLPSPLPSMSLSPSPLNPNRRRSGSRTRPERHNVRDEVPPNDRFNQPAFQKSMRDTKEILIRLVGVLGSGAVRNEPDSAMQRIYTQARALSQFECPSRRTVGVVGDSGAGKSSLLNSLLDCRDLARSSNGGGACTCVVTEFHYHQEERFAIKVETFSEGELMPQLEGLLQDYRHYHLNRDSFDPQELLDKVKRADIARDTFKAMFPRKFVNQVTFIGDTEPGSLSTLRSWLRSFDRTRIRETLPGLSLEECSSLLMQLSSDVQTSEAPLWPWIKKIMVYSNAHILNKGLILVDLPGLRDLNTARRNITERYLLKCNEIFVVASEGRATTDEGVKSVIELAKKARLSNVGIICTKSDEINPEEALKDWRGKPAAKEIQGMLDIIKRENAEKAELDEEMDDFKDIGLEELDDNERREFTRLASRQEANSQRLRACKFELQKFLITTRNTIVKKKLAEIYEHEVPGNRLEVFCASNKIYWDWRQKPKDKAMRSLELSGILLIRQYCMSIVSDSQCTAATKWMKDDVSVLLGELDLWVRSAQGSLSAEKKQKIRSTLDHLERKLYLDLCGHTSRLNVANAFKHEFDAKLYRQRVTYTAFCCNYGNHSTRAVGYHNWNEEIISEMVVSLSPLWGQLESSLDRQGEGIKEFLDGLLEEAHGILCTNLNDSIETAHSISSTLEAQICVLRAEFDDILDDFVANLRTLRTDALSGIRTSFIGKAMEDAYQNARHEGGDRSDARRKATINSAVRRHGLFIDLLKSAKREFDNYTNGMQGRIGEIGSSHFESIRETFNIIRSDNIALESERDPQFRRQLEATLVTTREEMQEIYSTIGIRRGTSAAH